MFIKRLNIIVLFASLFLFSVTEINAQLFPTLGGQRAGISTAQFLKIGVGGRATAMADAFIAHVRAMAASFDIPETLDALREQDIPSLARAALKEAHLTYAVPKYMDQKTCEGLIGQMLPR